MPSFENDPEQYVPLVLVQRGDRAAIEHGVVLEAIAARLLTQATSQSATLTTTTAVAAVADAFGIGTADVERAIRQWTKKPDDNYSRGATALLEHRYPDAARLLVQAVSEREQALADAAFSLGRSLHEQGLYARAASAYAKCADIRGDDALVLNNWALAVLEAGDLDQSQKIFERALQAAQTAHDELRTASVLSNVAYLLRLRGNSREALPLLEKALALRVRLLGPKHEDTTMLQCQLNDILVDLRLEQTINDDLVESAELDHSGVAYSSLLMTSANMHSARGEFSVAVRELRGALAIREQQLGARHPWVSSTLNDFGFALYQSGDTEGAVASLRRSVMICEQVLGSDHFRTGMALRILGQLLSFQGKPDEGEAALRRAHRILRGAFREQDLPPALASIALGESLAVNHNSAEGLTLATTGLQIAVAHFADDHPDVAFWRSMVAFVQALHGKYHEAEQGLIPSLAAVQERLGPNHLITGLILNSLAEVRRLEGRCTDAVQLHRQALRIFETQLGPKHLRTLISRRNLGTALLHCGLLKEAAPQLQSALRDIEGNFGVAHPQLAEMHYQLSMLNVLQGRFAEGETHAREAISRIEHLYGTNHAYMAYAHGALGASLRGRQQYLDAAAAFRRAIALAESSLGPSHPEVGVLVSQLGLTFDDMDDLPGAETAYRRAKTLLEQSCGLNSPRLALVLHNLGLLLARTRRCKEAEPLIRRALSLADGAYPRDSSFALQIRDNVGVYETLCSRRR